MGLSIRGYARHRRCSHKAVQKALAAGRITAGADGLIDPVMADRDWAARTASRMDGQNGHPAPKAPMDPNSATVAQFRAAGTDGVAYQRARTRKMRTDAQRAALELRVRRGELIDRAAGERVIFAFGRMLRDRWQAWPARIAGELAATLGVDAGVLVVELERYVDAFLHEVADERCNLDAAAPRAVRAPGRGNGAGDGE